MYNFNGTYIDPAEIIALESFDTDDRTYPYGLRVRLRGGLNYGVRYVLRRARDNEAHNINATVVRERADTSGLESIRQVEKELAGARRDIREIKRLVRTGESGR